MGLNGCPRPRAFTGSMPKPRLWPRDAGQGFPGATGRGVGAISMGIPGSLREPGFGSMTAREKNHEYTGVGLASMEREVRADEYSCAGNALRTCADEKSST
eukprot:SAG11_NODE_1147_length_5683_cov_40.952006_8_plen_101_part_00